jgi:hypothetical protein
MSRRDRPAAPFSFQARGHRRHRDRRRPPPFAQFSDVQRHPPGSSRQNQQQDTARDAHSGDRHGHRLRSFVSCRNHHANHEKSKRTQCQNHCSAKRQHCGHSLAYGTIHFPDLTTYPLPPESTRSPAAIPIRRSGNNPTPRYKATWAARPEPAGPELSTGSFASCSSLERAARATKILALLTPKSSRRELINRAQYCSFQMRGPSGEHGMLSKAMP